MIPSENTLIGWLQEAKSMGQQGQWHKAERLYRKILSAKPDQAEAFYGQANACYHLGRHELGLAAIAKFIALRSGNAAGRYTQALLLAALGQGDQAIVAYRAALSLNPAFIQAQFNLGLLYQEQGQLDQALHWLEAAALAAPHPLTLCGLGGALLKAERNAEAIACFLRAQALEPAAEGADFGLAMGYENQGDHAAAIAHYRKAFGSDKPAVKAEAANRLGLLLSKLGRAEESAEAFRQGLAATPDDPQMWLNLGGVLVDCGQHDGAKEAFGRAIKIEPDNAQAHSFLAYRLLAEGDDRQGWPEHEWRLKAASCKIPHLDAPRFTLDMPAGTRVLIQTEQGFGDSLQFARYGKILAERGYRPILQAPAPLTRLLQTLDGVEVPEETVQALQIDACIPLMSLPLAFAGEIPLADGYLRVPPGGGQDLPALDPALFHVGVVWAGDPKHPQDSYRSLPAGALGALRDLPGLCLHSLQKPSRAADLAEIGRHLPVEDWSGHLHDFADTARAVQQMDLVLTVDTSIAHLAGALGKPVWVLLAYEAEWRWRRQGESTPWYRSARLWRQRKMGDWDEVMHRLRAELADYIG